MPALLAAPLLALSVPPPPIVTSPVSVPGLIAFPAAQVRCGGAPEAPVLSEKPHPVTAFLSTQDTRKSPPIKLRFRIDPSGRPLGIKTEAGASSHADVLAAFAAWRFAAGEERRDCEIEFGLDAVPVAAADLATIHRWLALPRPQQYGGNPAAWPAAFERAKPAGDCFDQPPPNVRLRGYPAFETIPQPQGTMSYSFIEFDIDAAGRPRNIRVAGSDGNEALDRQSVDAVARSRFQPGARRGCNYPYHRRQPEPMKAPEPPSSDSFRPAGSTCPDEQGAWASMPPLVFPSELQRRAIEGWAMIGYDLAPWGATGNVRVLASEPVEAFGVQAMRIVNQARRPASSSGYVGCATLVRFVMPARDGRVPKTPGSSRPADPWPTN